MSSSHGKSNLETDFEKVTAIPDPRSESSVRKRDEIIFWAFTFLVIVALSLAARQRNAVWSSTLGLWHDCAKKSPSKERVRTALGHAYIDLKLWDDAQKELEEALRLDPNSSSAWLDLGVVFYHKGLIDEEINCYNEALQAELKLPEKAQHLAIIYNNLGQAYGRKGQTANAFWAFSKLVERKPILRKAYLNLGLACLALRRFEQAISSFESELEFNPDSDEAYVGLGIAYRELHDYRNAIAYLKKALTLPTPHPEMIKEQISIISRNIRN